MSTTRGATDHDTPELVCILDRELPFATRAVEALGRNMMLYADGEEFPGWDALQRCAWEGLGLGVERFNPLLEFDFPLRRNLRRYPKTLAHNIREGDINMSILLNTIGGSVGHIGLFRSAAHHILEHGGKTVRTFAVRAHSAGAHIGMLAPKNHRAVTRRGQYLWHTGDYYTTCSGNKIDDEGVQDVLEIQQELLREVSQKQRRSMHQLLLNVLADEQNKRHEIILDGGQLQDFGIINRIARNPEELARMFVRTTGIHPDFFVPGTDPTARFFLHATLEEQAREEGYRLSFSRQNAVRDFSLRGESDRKKRDWRDVREDLLDSAEDFTWRMWEILRGKPFDYAQGDTLM